MKSIDSIIREQVKKIVEDMDIDPKNKGKFTATQKRTGKSTDELCHSKNPLTRKRANFAKMAKRHWKPLDEQFCREVMESTIRRIMKEGLEVTESRKRRVNEAFRSDELRSWFKEHGGVKKHFDDYPDANVPQEGAGDIDDDDIVYKKEYDDYKQAVMAANRLNHEKKSDMSRSDMSAKALFTVYRANDGKCLVVGIDRANNPTGVNWGGEHLKKKSDRIWRDNRKKWDANDYEYGRSAKYFGVYDDKDLKGLGKYNKRIRQRSTDDEWNDYQNRRVKDMKDYYKNNHVKGLR